MIVRIATEGQYDIPEVDVPALTELDQEAVVACEGGQEEHFREVFTRLVSFVRSHGSPVPEDELASSELILPPPDVSLEEAREEFSGEGLLPG